ncbi:MAG: sulfotransferase family 2 domain-containing protein [Cyanobacteria bacterium P01_F01_bin.143]
MHSSEKITKVKALFLEGNQLRKEDQLAEAIKKYSEALQAKPNYLPALNHLARIYETRNEYEKARRYYQLAIEQNPKKATAHANLAKVLLNQDQIQESIDAYKKAISLESNLPEYVYIDFGDALNKNGQTAEAITAHKKAIKIKSQDPQFRLRDYWINHDLKLIFCAIPKNANTLFKTMLVEYSQNSAEYKKGNLNVHQYFSENKDFEEEFALKDISYLDNPEYFKFVILRNPFRRLVSGYINKFVSPIVESMRRKKKFTPTKPISAQGKIIREVSEFLGIEPDFEKSVTFDQFIRYLSRTEDVKLNIHWRPQHTFLGLGLFKFKYDFIGKFEELNLVIEHLEKKFDIQVNKNVMGKSHITNYKEFTNSGDFCHKYPIDFLELEGVPSSNQLYTPELEALVRVRYAEDIALYEREFNVTPRP